VRRVTSPMPTLFDYFVAPPHVVDADPSAMT
jgi:hypothetical protein